MKTIRSLALGVSIAAVVAVSANAQTELVGAVQFDESHSYTKALREFERAEP